MQFYTTADAPTDLIQRSFTANLLTIGPNGGAPLWALSGLAKTKFAKSTAHFYWSKTQVFPSVTLDGAIASGVITTFVVDTTDNIKVGSQLWLGKASGGTWNVPEIVEVIDVTSTTVLEVVRGTGAAAIADNAILYETGNAYEQGSAAPTSRAIKPVDQVNYTQIFRDTWDITRTLATVSMETNYETMHENMTDAAFYHSQAIETASIFGRKGSGTKNGRPFTTMDGIEASIENIAPQNLFSAGATTTYAQLEAMLNPLFDQKTNLMSGNVRTLYCGSTAIQVINEIGRISGTFQILEDTTEFGTQFYKFKTSRGFFEMIEHPILNTNPTWSAMVIAAEFSSFDFRYLTETMHEDIANDGTDATSGVYTTELTLELRNPFAWGIIYDLTAAA